MPNVFGEQYTQVPLTEDQHAVGEFGSDRADEPFGDRVAPRCQLHLISRIGVDVCG
jgi:hypothetical protein